MTEKFYIKGEVDENGENKDLGVYESGRLIRPDSYDDDWNLTRYTSELRNESDNSFFAFIDFEGDEGSIRLRPHCEESGFHNKLGPKILKKDERPAPDNDQWLSCYECGNTFPIYQTFAESQIKDSLETVSNPYEANEPVFLTTDSRKTTRKKRELRDGHRKGVHKYRSKRIDYSENEDPDIQREIDRYGVDNVHVIQ